MDIPFAYDKNPCEECIFAMNLQEQITELEIQLEEYKKREENWRERYDKD